MAFYRATAHWRQGNRLWGNYWALALKRHWFQETQTVTVVPQSEWGLMEVR